jgi:hypothetical protein
MGDGRQDCGGDVAEHAIQAKREIHAGLPFGEGCDKIVDVEFHANSRLNGQQARLVTGLLNLRSRQIEPTCHDLVKPSSVARTTKRLIHVPGPHPASRILSVLAPDRRNSVNMLDKHAHT